MKRRKIWKSAIVPWVEGRAWGTASSRGANDMPKKKKSYKLGTVHKTIYGIIRFYLPSTFLIFC